MNETMNSEIELAVLRNRLYEEIERGIVLQTKLEESYREKAELESEIEHLTMPVQDGN
ncbi:hypothetical protein [Mammaliicoccus sciuri]|uniref:hypothetical protein n=1 Tax=Mammaliicoccus sciuri TaxID=1296 RepID=UPI0034DD67FA